MFRPQLIVRADASTEIGAGHVMRCLAIAQAWHDAGGNVTFASAKLPESLRLRIQNEGFQTQSITADAGSVADAAQLLDTAAKCGATAIIVDGYTFDVDYHAQIANTSFTSLVIDDNSHLARYSSDFVLNQNAAVTSLMYPDCSSQTDLLLGTSYALLRREFLVGASKQPEARQRSRRILVTLGGADSGNVTAKVIEGLQLLAAFEVTVRVIVGSMNPNRDSIAEHVGSDMRFKMLQDVADMSEHYRWADIAIAAGGSSNWEMCYFGLPRIVLIVADNQVQIANELEREQIAINLGNATGVEPIEIRNAVERLLGDSERLLVAHRHSIKMVDGKGAARCVERLLGHAKSQGADLPKVQQRSSASQLVLRDAKIDDWQLLLRWRNDPATRSASRTTAIIDESAHRNWLQDSLEAENRRLLIAEVENLPVGSVRFDLDELCEVSWTVAPEARGKGYGKQMVSAAVRSVPLRMKAVARVENVGSQKIAEAAGFQLIEDDGEWQTFYRRPGNTD